MAPIFAAHVGLFKTALLICVANVLLALRKALVNNSIALKTGRS
jgi:hypothetical protein